MDVVDAGLDPNGDIYIYTLAAGIKWAGTALTYSFPTTAAQFTGYGPGEEPSNNFEVLNAAQQAAVKAAFAALSSFTNLTFTEQTGADVSSATLRFGMSDDPTTAYGYYPYPDEIGGDSWYNNSTGWFDAPILGNYAYLAFFHEIGHTLGLDHPHESTPPMPLYRDHMSWTVMSYRSYYDAPVTGYTNDEWSFAQSYMAVDIETLQALYGANYTSNAGDTVYSWSPATGEFFINGVGQGAPGGNKVFMTVWDGGGNDTYDFSNYSGQGLSITIQPGEWIQLPGQKANVGYGGSPAGNIANSYLHDGDTRSLIENVIGSQGNDTIVGNDAANHIVGGGGLDFVYGLGGDDLIEGSALAQYHGGDGNDTLYGSIHDDQLFGDAGNDLLKGDLGSDALNGGDGNDRLEGGLGDDYLDGGEGNDVLVGDAGYDRLTGGTGDDVYYIDNWKDPLLNPDGSYFFWLGLSDIIVEKVDEGNDTIVTSVSLTLPNTIYVETLKTDDIAGTGSINLTGNTLDNTIYGNAGNNTLDGKGGNDTLYGNDGNDLLIGTSGNDSLNGGNGNDGLYFGADLTAADSADGGAGDDQLGLQGNYAGLTLGAMSLVNIETLVLLPGSDTRFGDTSGSLYSYNLSTVDANVGAGQLLTVNFNTLRNGENVTFNGSAETNGSFLTFGGSGNDAITGGMQVDGFYFGGGKFGAGDVLNGGGGNDQLGLQGDYSGGNAVTFGAGQLTSIESIIALSGADTRFGGGGLAFSYTFTMNDANVAAGVNMIINANTLRSNEVLTFNGGAETNGSFSIFGGAGNDVITTGAGNDTIYGGAGADFMTGGAGNDSFVYLSAAHSTVAAQDHIVGFGNGTDLVNLSNIDAIAGTGANDAFTFIGSAAFSNVAGQLRAYDNGGGTWYAEGDTDGDGVPDLSIAFDNPLHALTGADFVL